MATHPSASRLRAISCIAVLISLAASPRSARAEVEDYLYLSPVPGSSMVRIWNNVIVRLGEAIDESTVSSDRLVVTGSTSGLHVGSFELSDDGETLVFTPFTPYELGETVEVVLQSGVKTVSDVDLPTLEFAFSVSTQILFDSAPNRFEMSFPERDPITAPAGSFVPGRIAGTPCDSFPAPIPPITLLVSEDPEPGATLMTPFGPGIGSGFVGNLLVVDNFGLPLFWRGQSDRPLDFKPQDGGLFSYVSAPDAVVLDSGGDEIDRYTTGNGYSIDAHDIQILPNGHVILMSYDPQPVGMDTVVSGGRADAIVTGLVLQELDLAKRVVFQWRSWDHILITDCASEAVSLTDSLIDYVHGNAVELDQDGNWLVSSRHLNEITKIDRQTGSILWRFGPNALQNQFTIVGDPRGFSHQHDIRRLPNGHVTLFDNGNFLDPEYSRGLEYELDEDAHIATLVWEYRNSPDAYGGFMGNVQRRVSGATMIGWGGTAGTIPRVTDLTPEGSKTLELGLPNLVWTYRAYRSPWQTPSMVATPEMLDFGVVLSSEPAPSLPVEIQNGSTDEDLTINCAFMTNPDFSVDATLPVTLPPGGTATWNVTFMGHQVGPASGRLYVRSVTDSDLVALPVDLKVSDWVGVESEQVGFRLYEPRPHPVRTAATFRFDLPSQVHVDLDVYDLSGRRMATIVKGVRSAGSHEVRWDAQTIPDGVYFYRLTAGGFTASGKFVHLQ